MWPKASIVVGAILFIGGLIANFTIPTQAQSSMTTSRTNLISALDGLALAIANASPVVIGSQTNVTAGPGTSGTVIGKQTTVTAGPGTTGTIIGEQTTVSSSGQTINGQKSAVIKDAAERVKSGSATKAEIASLIAQSSMPGINPELNSAMQRANQALQASDLP